MTEQPAEAWHIVEDAGASEAAVIWARQFGADMRQMWNVCDHGELMMGIAAFYRAPIALVVMSGVEIIQSSMPRIMSMVDVDVVASVAMIEDWLRGDIDIDVDLEVDTLMRVAVDAEEECDGINANAAQAVASLVVAIDHASHNGCKSFAQSASLAPAFAAKLRAGIAIEQGKSECVAQSMAQGASCDFAAIVRRNIPYTVLAASPLSLALGSQAASA